ncbi:mannose-6-phosphate isomerase-like protein (cupin superfamily) [Bradyrhizobium sp. GM24.11]
MSERATTEVLHLKSEDMKFTQFYPDAGGYASQCRLITPEISKTLGAGIATYDGCSIEWTTKYDQVAIVLEGVLRIRMGENFSRVIEAKAGDVVWLPKGTRMKYEGDKAKMFYAPSPGDWRIQSAATVVDAAAEHFRDESVPEELVTASRMENWTVYEMKGFLDLVIAESGNRKLNVNCFRMPSALFTAVGATGDSARGGTYNGVPVTVAAVGRGVEIVFRPA